LNRTLIVVVTWNRLKILKHTIKTFCKKNGACHDFLIIDNGSTDGTRKYIKKMGFDSILNGKNEGIFFASRRGWMEGIRRGYDFILNLQDDFPCIRSVPFAAAESYLDSREDVGFVRLNDKRKMIKVHSDGRKTIKKTKRTINKLTKKNLRYKDWEEHEGVLFQKHNHQFSFNPNLFKSSIVESLVGEVRKPREIQIMEEFEKLKLFSVRLRKPCFETILYPRRKDWVH